MLGYYHEEKAKKIIFAKENSPNMQPVSYRELRASCMTGHVTQF